MIAILLVSTITLLVPCTLMFLNTLVSKKTIIDREKSSPYECGFDPLNSSTESFSIQFFLISIMFLTFDIEIVILIPLVPAIKMKSIYWLISAMMIMIILIMGLYIEWMESSIKWEN